MKLIYFSLIFILCFSCTNNGYEKEYKSILKNLDSQNKIIKNLEDSIANFNKTESFDSFKPIAIGVKEIKERSSKMEILVGHIAFKKNTPKKLRYWIDDTTFNSNKMIEYESENGFDKLVLDLKNIPEHSKQAFETGEHEIFGKIKTKKNGLEVWESWRFNYSVK